MGFGRASCAPLKQLTVLLNKVFYLKRPPSSLVVELKQKIFSEHLFFSCKQRLWAIKPILKYFNMSSIDLANR